MTYYFYPNFPRHFRRRMMERVMNDLDLEDQSMSQVSLPVDVEAREDAYVITALLPGILPEDLNIQVVNETVTISGEMKVERDEKASYLVAERPSGKFNRVLTLPTSLDPEHSEARFEHGVLTLSVPKAPDARPRTIKVNVK